MLPNTKYPILTSGVSPPSRVNSPIFLYIYLYVMGTTHTVMLYVLLILRAHSPLANNA